MNKPNREFRPGYLRKYEKWDLLWKKYPGHLADKALRELQWYVKRFGMYREPNKKPNKKNEQTK